MAAQLERIARTLRERVERSFEAERGTTTVEPLTGTPVLSKAAFRRAMRLKEEFAREFDGAELSECYRTQELENEFGRCLSVAHHAPGEVPRANPNECRRALCRELKLLWGVGPRVEAKLKASGYRDLHDLSDHHRWGSEAHSLVREIEAGDLRGLQRLIHRWFPVSHPLGLVLLGLVPRKRWAIFDLESLGLFGRPVVLLGFATLSQGGLEIRQYLARDITEELPALVECARMLGAGAPFPMDEDDRRRDEPALVSYNGRAFDVNFVRERLNYYGLLAELEPLHFDLLPHTRRHFRDLPDARLETVEGRLGLKRSIDLPSALVPDYYNTYIETGNIGPLIPIIEHNKHDLIALSALLPELLPA